MRLILAFIASLCFICSAHAVEYPTEPVRMLVGWAPGEVPIGFAAMAGAVPLVKSGRVRVLGLTTAHRVVSENRPTLAEEGVPIFNYAVWTGLFVQKGTPADIARKLRTATPMRRSSAKQIYMLARQAEHPLADC